MIFLCGLFFCLELRKFESKSTDVRKSTVLKSSTQYLCSNMTLQCIFSVYGRRLTVGRWKSEKSEKTLIGTKKH